MFITKGDVSIAVDMISKFSCGYSGFKDRSDTQYYILIEVKDFGGRKITGKYGDNIETLPPETIYFKYGNDMDARDTAYKVLVDKFSLEL